MKRSHTDDSNHGDERYTKVKLSHNNGSVGSASPSSLAASPAYGRVTPHHHQEKYRRRFVGSSKLSDYKLQQKLGEGTFGEVHKGIHRTTGAVVALKRILMHNEKEGIPITAIREIKILKQLHHKNIVPLTDLAVERGDSSKKEQGSIYMVFPYMDHDLAGLLENPLVKLTAPQMKTYIKQLLEGTAYLHHNKILHRDIKAANLLINNEGILQIADFGLARGIEDENKEYTSCVVTRWYRPPELFLGERKYTTAIDMWGVGCILGELIKGRPILQGADDIDQLRRIFYLCGSPTEESMPGYRSLPDADKFKFESTQRRVKEEFARVDPLAVELLDKLLVLDHSKRLTAVEALNHDYFYTNPPPAKPSELPKYEASHEYDRRRVRSSNRR
ncbi:kinase-like domain-containing protein [Fennellomyces sp. T-0311]|nr:kinase-like domain-containing protein [Fennellomyces sp. T-0311]